MVLNPPDDTVITRHPLADALVRDRGFSETKAMLRRIWSAVVLEEASGRAAGVGAVSDAVHDHGSDVEAKTERQHGADGSAGSRA